MNEAQKLKIKINVMQRLVELQARGTLTSKGEPISLAAIGRTLDPPVTRVTVLHVRDGAQSERVRRALERELKTGAIWMPKKSRDRG